MSQTSLIPEGLLLIDKPTGPTSHDIVNSVRRQLQMKRVGHAGTLDPMATGLLIMLIGKATKVSQYLMSLDKTYQGTLQLGQTTDSHDRDGKITATRDVPELTKEEVLAYMKEFVGDQYQIPPMFSAKKIHGVPLYKLARKGKVVEREPRFIRVSSFELLELNLPQISFIIRSSKGTYVRTIAHDLGEKIGCGAHLSNLRRTAIDHFKVDDAVTLDAFTALSPAEIQKRLIPVYQAVPSNIL